MFQSPHIRLLVSDFPVCFRFYRDVLGFTPTFGAEDEVYADFDANGQTIALFQRELMAEATGADAEGSTPDDVVVVLATRDVDAAAGVLRAKGVTRFGAGRQAGLGHPHGTLPRSRRQSH